MNFELQVRLKKVAEGGSFGVLIRYDESKTAGYAFTILPHGEYMFAMIKGETDSALFKEPVDLNRDIKGWDTAKIICIGQKFDFYLNDEFLSSVTDKKYNRGRIGFFLGGDPRQKAMFQIISLKQL